MSLLFEETLEIVKSSTSADKTPQPSIVCLAMDQTTESRNAAFSASSKSSNRNFFAPRSGFKLFLSLPYAKAKMDYPEDNYDRSKMLNLLALLIENISFHIQALVRHYNHILKRFMENFEIIEFFDTVSDKLSEHPLLRFTVFTVAISCTIPVVMFILFGIASLIITFAGFLFIEGTLLAVGGICMFICMAMMTLVLSLLAVTLVTVYVLTLKLGNILNKFETTSHIMRSIVPASPHANQIMSLTANSHQN